MSCLREEISRIANSPLSSEIGTELISTADAVGALRATLQMSSSANLAHEATVFDELKYAYIFVGEEYESRDLLTNSSCRQLYERLAIALEFLGNKLSQHNLIPATDLLRISEFIRTGKEIYLQDATFSDTCSTLAEQVNNVLDIAYNACSKQHWLIKVAVICCGLGFNKTIEPLALYALGSVLANQGDMFTKLPFSVCKYLLFEGLFEGQAYASDEEQSIQAFLRHLKHSFVGQTILLNDIEAESKNIREKIRKIIPRDSVRAIENILKTKLSFTGAEIQNSTHVTYRTAFEYICRLKNAGIIDSVRVGKENVYINTQILSKVERGLSDGTEKS